MERKSKRRGFGVGGESTTALLARCASDKSVRPAARRDSFDALPASFGALSPADASDASSLWRGSVARRARIHFFPSSVQARALALFSSRYVESGAALSRGTSIISFSLSLSQLTGKSCVGARRNSASRRRRLRARIAELQSSQGSRQGCGSGVTVPSVQPSGLLQFACLVLFVFFLGIRETWLKWRFS